MTSITLNAADSARYENDDAFRRETDDRAQRRANETGKTCEIYHVEGYVLDVKHAQ